MLLQLPPPEYASSVDPSAFDEFAYKHDSLKDQNELQRYRHELHRDAITLLKPVTEELNHSHTKQPVEFIGYRFQRNDHKTPPGENFGLFIDVWHVDRVPDGVAIVTLLADAFATESLSGVLDTTRHPNLDVLVGDIAEADQHTQRSILLNGLRGLTDNELIRDGMTIKDDATDYSALIVPSELAHRSTINKAPTTILRHLLFADFGYITK